MCDVSVNKNVSVNTIMIRRPGWLVAGILIDACGLRSLLWLAMKQTRPRAKKREAKAKQSAKIDTLAGVQEAYFAQGALVARALLRGSLSEELLRNYHVIPPLGGKPSIRTDTSPRDEITYSSFEAPAHWEAPFNILRATFSSRAQVAYLHHSGEELLSPLDGSIMYHFHWSAGGERPRRRLLDSPLAVGDLVRIQSAVPHHTWSMTKPGATAWMIFRDVSGTSPSISFDASRPATKELRASRRVTEDELHDAGRPAFYAFLAWGLAERLQLYRDRARRSVAEVAHQCGIDASHLSRIENGDTNVSLDVLDRLATFLHLDLENLIDEKPWHYLRATLSSREVRPADSHGWLLCPEGREPPHYLHARQWAASTSQREVAVWLESRSLFTSWIILKGRLIVRADKQDAARRELLEAGSVIHFRGAVPRWIHVLDEVKCLEIVYMLNCPPRAESNVKVDRRRGER